MISALATYQSNSFFAAFKAEPAARNESDGSKPLAENSRRDDISFADRKVAARIQDRIFNSAELFSSRNSGREAYGYGSSETSREISVSSGGREVLSASASSGYAYEYEVSEDSVSFSFSRFASAELSFGGENSGSKAAEFEFEIEIRSDGSISFSMSSYMTKEANKDGFGSYKSEVETSFNLEISADGTMIQEYEAYSQKSFLSDFGNFGIVQTKEVEASLFVADISQEGLSTTQLQDGFDPEMQSVMNNLEGVLQDIDDKRSDLEDKKAGNEFSIFSMSSTVSSSSIILAYQEY